MRTTQPAFSALAVILFAAPMLAQSLPGIEHIDTPAKKDLLSRTQKAIEGQEGSIRLLATPRTLVVYRSTSKHEADQYAAADAARASAKRIELLLDVCERFLPPHAKCGDRFLVIDSADAMMSIWKASEGPEAGEKWGGTLAEEFARAQQFSVVGRFEYLSVWAIYEKAWFGDSPPANWLTDLGIARVKSQWNVALDQAGSNKKGKLSEPFTKQMARLWSRLDGKEIETALANLAPGMGPPGWRGMNGASAANELIAAFLGHAQPDLKKQFLPQWEKLVPAYAERRIAGDTDAVAAAAALGDLDRKALAVSIKKWATSRSK